VRRAQEMLDGNIGTANVAQWLCIRIKEECYGYRRGR